MVRRGLRRDPDPLAAHRYLARLYEELFHDSPRARRHYNAFLQLGGSRADAPARAGTVCVGDGEGPGRQR